VIEMMKTPVEAIMIGAGNRGTFAYGAYAERHPDEIRFTAVAEPDLRRRERFARLHAIPPERQFETWEQAAASGQLAPAALNCTMDRMHYASTMALLQAGYEVLLEKPIAPSLAECAGLVETAERLGRILQVCHVLRYTSFFSTLYEIVRSGRLGEVITIDHRENAAYWHMAHSYVRGLWRNQADSGPMILTKCCHDLDLLIWLTGQVPRRVSSFGSLSHYRVENAPPGAPPRCTDGCPVEEACPWYAPRLYGARPSLDFSPPAWLTNPLTGAETPAERYELLKTHPLGRCVYHCDNDVVDHQVALLEFPGGQTCTFTMHGHAEREGRSMRWDGTRATLYGEFSEGRDEIRIHDHRTNSVEIIHPIPEVGGHSGGDSGLMEDFVRTLRGESPSPHQTSARISLESHRLAFAIEAARQQGKTLEIENLILH
jgi:predicted dehydrogenase